MPGRSRPTSSGPKRPAWVHSAKSRSPRTDGPTRSPRRCTRAAPELLRTTPVGRGSGRAHSSSGSDGASPAPGISNHRPFPSRPR
jgi:hypothetical protein